MITNNFSHEKYKRVMESIDRLSEDTLSKNDEHYREDILSSHIPSTVIENAYPRLPCSNCAYFPKYSRLIINAPYHGAWFRLGKKKKKTNKGLEMASETLSQISGLSENNEVLETRSVFEDKSLNLHNTCLEKSLIPTLRIAQSENQLFPKESTLLMNTNRRQLSSMPLALPEEKKKKKGWAKYLGLSTSHRRASGDSVQTSKQSELFVKSVPSEKSVYHDPLRLKVDNHSKKLSVYSPSVGGSSIYHEDGSVLSNDAQSCLSGSVTYTEGEAGKKQRRKKSSFFSKVFGTSKKKDKNVETLSKLDATALVALNHSINTTAIQQSDILPSHTHISSPETYDQRADRLREETREELLHALSYVEQQLLLRRNKEPDNIKLSDNKKHQDDDSKILENNVVKQNIKEENGTSSEALRITFILNKMRTLVNTMFNDYEFSTALAELESVEDTMAYRWVRNGGELVHGRLMLDKIAQRIERTAEYQQNQVYYKVEEITTQVNILRERIRQAVNNGFNVFLYRPKLFSSIGNDYTEFSINKNQINRNTMLSTSEPLMPILPKCLKEAANITSVSMYTDPSLNDKMSNDISIELQAGIVRMVKQQIMTKSGDTSDGFLLLSSQKDLKLMEQRLDGKWGSYKLFEKWIQQSIQWQWLDVWLQREISERDIILDQLINDKKKDFFDVLDKRLTQLWAGRVSQVRHSSSLQFADLLQETITSRQPSLLASPLLPLLEKTMMEFEDQKSHMERFLLYSGNQDIFQKFYLPSEDLFPLKITTSQDLTHLIQNASHLRDNLLQHSRLSEGLTIHHNYSLMEKQLSQMLMELQSLQKENGRVFQDNEKIEKELQDKKQNLNTKILKEKEKQGELEFDTIKLSQLKKEVSSLHESYQTALKETKEKIKEYDDIKKKKKQAELDKIQLEKHIKDENKKHEKLLNQIEKRTQQTHQSTSSLSSVKKLFQGFVPHSPRSSKPLGSLTSLSSTSIQRQQSPLTDTTISLSKTDTKTKHDFNPNQEQFLSNEDFCESLSDSISQTDTLSENNDKTKKKKTILNKLGHAINFKRSHSKKQSSSMERKNSTPQSITLPKNNVKMTIQPLTYPSSSIVDQETSHVISNNSSKLTSTTSLDPTVTPVLMPAQSYSSIHHHAEDLPLLFEPLIHQTHRTPEPVSIIQPKKYDVGSLHSDKTLISDLSITKTASSSSNSSSFLTKPQHSKKDTAIVNTYSQSPIKPTKELDIIPSFYASEYSDSEYSTASPISDSFDNSDKKKKKKSWLQLLTGSRKKLVKNNSTLSTHLKKEDTFKSVPSLPINENNTQSSKNVNNATRAAISSSYPYSATVYDSRARLDQDPIHTNPDLTPIYLQQKKDFSKSNEHVIKTLPQKVTSSEVTQDPVNVLSSEQKRKKKNSFSGMMHDSLDNIAQECDSLKEEKEKFDSQHTQSFSSDIISPSLVSSSIAYNETKNSSTLFNDIQKEKDFMDNDVLKSQFQNQSLIPNYSSVMESHPIEMVSNMSDNQSHLFTASNEILIDSSSHQLTHPYLLIKDTTGDEKLVHDLRPSSHVLKFDNSSPIDNSNPILVPTTSEEYKTNPVNDDSTQYTRDKYMTTPDSPKISSPHTNFNTFPTRAIPNQMSSKDNSTVLKSSDLSFQQSPRFGYPSTFEADSDDGLLYSGEKAIPPTTDNNSIIQDVLCTPPGHDINKSTSNEFTKNNTKLLESHHSVSLESTHLFPPMTINIIPAHPLKNENLSEKDQTTSLVVNDRIQDLPEHLKTSDHHISHCNNHSMNLIENNDVSSGIVNPDSDFGAVDDQNEKKELPKSQYIPWNRRGAAQRLSLLYSISQVAPTPADILFLTFLFKSLTQIESERLATVLTTVHIGPCEVLFEFGDFVDILYIIAEGTVHIFTQENEQEKLVDTLKQGSVVLDREFVKGCYSSTKVITATTCVLYKITQATFGRVVTENQQCLQQDIQELLLKNNTSSLNLTDFQAKYLTKHLKLHYYQDTEIIVQKNSSGNVFFILLTGNCTLDPDNEYATEQLSRGAIFGTEVLHNNVYNHTVIANHIKGVSIASISTETFMQLEETKGTCSATMNELTDIKNFSEQKSTDSASYSSELFESADEKKKKKKKVKANIARLFRRSSKKQNNHDTEKN